MNKIALGTAQFGFDYGINNQRGIIPEREIVGILDCARQNGVDTLDTAHAYGVSEERIGRYVSENGDVFRIVSKLPECGLGEVEGLVVKSLERLKTQKIYGYLLHSYTSYRKDPRLLDTLKKLQKENRVSKIGFTIYFPSELEFIIESGIDFNLIQFPYSVFDQRFEQYFDVLKERCVEIHVRSVFLQGLVFKNMNMLGNRFDKIKDKLMRLRRLAEELQIGVLDLCLNFVLLNGKIDRVIVGVDSLGHLQQLVLSKQHASKVQLSYDELRSLKEDDEKTVVPLLWGV